MEENTSYEVMDSRELLSELLRYQKKEVRHARLATIVSVLLIGALLVTLLVALPRAVTVLDHMETSLEQIDVFVEGANQVVSQNTDAVTEAVGKLNGLDFDALNKAIRDLSDTVGPLANFARLFQ